MAVPSWAQSQLAQLRGGFNITRSFWQRYGLTEGLRRLVQTKESHQPLTHKAAVSAAHSAGWLPTNVSVLTRLRALCVRLRRVMDGELKGQDQFGNQYYENLKRPPGRQRFVIYRGWGKEVDPSQLPAEWHHWLHAITDRTPVERPVKLHKYQLSHTAHQLSGHGMEGRYAPPGSYVRTEPKQHTSYNVWEKESVKDQDNSGTQPRV